MDKNENTLNNDEIHGSDSHEGVKSCASGSCCTSGSCCSFKMWVLIGIALGLLWYFAN
ncbi:MAG: hypothetical protein K8R13_03260 [Methanococcoides sp.]|nr:hypothetical protein [Methanococcoides sp.]